MKESSQARQAFDVYLAMGPGRSLAKVGQHLGKSRIIIERWSAAHHWQERIREHEQRIAEQVAAEEAEERKRAREERLRAARDARTKGVEALAHLSAADLVRLPSAIVRLLEYADATERRDLGEPDQRVAVAAPDGGAIEFTIQLDDSTMAHGLSPAVEGATSAIGEGHRRGQSGDDPHHRQSPG